MSAIPRLVIAGTHSGVGKTTIATALMAALTRRGMRVQPFKVGPDFIDPGFHQAACGRASRNLDGWMLSRETNLGIFERASSDAGIAVIEGVMGLFDGRSPAAEEGSTAEMAKWLDAPVLLVVDASAMARSAAAVVSGFDTFDPDLNLAGVLFNRVGSPGHAALLRESLTAYCRAPMLGALPGDKNIAMPSRHLGLTMAGEALTESHLAAMAAWIEKGVGLDALLAGADHRQLSSANSPSKARDGRVRVGIARDAAFCFYYQDNLDLLTSFGAELVEFSPISDAQLPAGIGGLYFGGGYPELHAAQLADNHSMLRAIRSFAESGAPIYAECGGFMYLTGAIVDTSGQEHPMAALFPTRARMQTRLAALGYAQPEPIGGTLWLQAGEYMRGHEFRYSTMDPMPPAVARAYGGLSEGYRVHSALGSYVHLHFLSCPGFAQRFVEHCAQWDVTQK